MEIKYLKTAILTNSIPNFMVFIEREQALGRQYIDSIATTLNKPFKVYSTADSVLYDITTNLKDDYLYVVYYDPKPLKNPAYAEELKKTNRSIILVYDDMDKTSSFYRQYSMNCVEFNKLDKYTIVAYLLKKLKDSHIAVEQDKIETLVDYCECDLGKCLNEIDKVITLGQESSNILVDYMLNNGFSDYRQINAFKFVNKILDGDKSVFEDYKILTDSPMTIMFNLYREAKRRLVQTNEYWYAQAMKLCSQLFSGVVDGTHSDTYALKYILWRLFI